MNSQDDLKSELVCAVDLGGTHLRAAIIDKNGEIHSRTKRTTPAANSPAQIVDAIVSVVRECQAAAAGPSLKGLSVVVPGTVNADAGKAIKVPNIPSLDGLNLVDALSRQLGLQVILENDANAAAVGELWRGAARDCRTIVCLTLGTGVGSGIILDGKLWRGANHSAAEIGHMFIEPEGAQCSCGNRGCLEAYASATAIVRMSRESLSHYSVSSLRDDDPLSSETIYQAGLNGDELALEVFRRMGSYLGMALANVKNILDPEMIVIDGGVANAWELFETPMLCEVAERTFSAVTAMKIVRGECGDNAGLLGAAYLWFELMK